MDLRFDVVFLYEIDEFLLKLEPKIRCWNYEKLL